MAGCRRHTAAADQSQPAQDVQIRVLSAYKTYISVPNIKFWGLEARAVLA